MNRYAQMISELKTPEVMKRLTYLYGQRGGMLVAQSARYSRLLKRHEELVGYEGPIAMVSAPGRTEIGGNHTDHNRGKVLAAAVNLDTLAAVSPRADGVVNIHSEGYTPLTLSLDDSSVHEAEKGTTAALLMQLSIDSGFVIIMLTTFGVLTFTVGLQPGWLALGLVAVARVGGLVFVIAVGGLKPQLVLKVLRPFVKLADKILAKFKKPAIDESVERTIHNFSSAAHLITKNPRKTVQSFLWTTLSSICEMSCFVLVGFAFGVHHPEALICGYVVATLFAMISFVPQGVGVVEAAVTVAFALFGIDSATGLAVVIVYRGIVFWLPFLVGAVVIQRIKAFMPLGKRDLKGKAEAMENGLPDKVEAGKQVEASEAAKWETAEARPELEKVPAEASGTATGPGTVPKETK